MKKLVYKLLEFFYRNGFQTAVSGISIKLPFRFSRYYEKDYEADNIRFFRTAVKRNDVVLDIGAQIGLMAKLFADLAGPGGKIYAFEPTPFTYGMLKKTIAYNGLEKTVVPVQAAVSDKKGKAIFNVSNVDIDAANSLSDLKRDRPVSGIEVDLTSVDRFAGEAHLSKIDFIKIDAEGAEYNVLLGAVETLNTYRPVINLALHPEALTNFGSSLEEIYDFVISKHYAVMFKSAPMSKKEFTSNSNLFDVQLLPK